MDLLSELSRVIPASYFAIACIGFWKNFIQTGKWISLIIKEDEIFDAYRECVRYRMIPLISVNPTSGEWEGRDDTFICHPGPQSGVNDPHIVFGLEAAPVSRLLKEIVVSDDFSPDGIRDILKGKIEGHVGIRIEEDRFGFEPEVISWVAQIGSRICEIGISHSTTRMWKSG